MPKSTEFIPGLLLLSWRSHSTVRNTWPLYYTLICSIELDSVSLETRLPKRKVDKCLSTISSFIARKKVTLRDIQSLKGMLNFACAVVVPGRAFWRRLIDLTLGLKSPTHFVRITHEVRSDLSVWQTFLASFNGRSFFLEDSRYSSEKLNLYTDGAGTLGFGTVFGHK